MTDAAAGDLQGSRRVELESHLNECATCRQEFQCTRMLIEAINLGVTAQAATEPSPRLIERVRQRIRDEAPAASWWNALRARWIPATACVAVLILAASIWILWPRNETRRDMTATSATPSAALAERPTVVASTAAPRSAPERLGPTVARVRRARKLNARRIERQPEMPEVVVEPGQMKAVMLFAQMLNSNQVDGAKLLADLKAPDQPLEVQPIKVQPLEIKPLVIAPLKTPNFADDKSNGDAPDGGEKNFISSEKSP